MRHIAQHFYFVISKLLGGGSCEHARGNNCCALCCMGGWGTGSICLQASGWINSTGVASTGIIRKVSWVSPCTILPAGLRPKKLCDEWHGVSSMFQGLLRCRMVRRSQLPRLEGGLRNLTWYLAFGTWYLVYTNTNTNTNTSTNTNMMK